ncbi:hypothetical protein BD779DRAFT_1430455, partial [Infundibulicybe gibba]
LEVHANATSIPHDDIPELLLRYCNKKVRDIIEGTSHWTTRNWSAARKYLLKLYGSNDETPVYTPEGLRLWVAKHAEQGKFNRIQDIDRYYRVFTAQSNQLRKGRPKILEPEVNILFYRGIPTPNRTKVKRRLPEVNTTTDDPPELETIFEILRKQFKVHDLDNITVDVSDFASDSEDGEEDEEDEEEETPA